MPYGLNGPLAEFRNNLSYISSFDKVNLYRVVETEPDFMGVPLHDTHLYFLQDKLITSYMHLENELKYVCMLREMFTEIIGTDAVISKSQFGVKYTWQNEEKVLVIVKDQIHRKFYLYHSLRQYNVHI